jgi:D-alanyl-D-alanine carboxypeptidase-like protein
VKRSLAAGLLVAVLALLPGGWASGGEHRDFRGEITRIDRDTKRLMTGRSWHRGCPVPIHDLRLLSLTFWGFDRAANQGQLVVHERWAKEMVGVFRRLYNARFPIRRLRLVDQYGADDLRSMRHDNTSAFNCRWRAGQPGVWSQHAYGRALDLNPVENPYVVGDHVSPPEGERFADRSRHRRGMIFRGDDAWRAFHNIGWEWGGQWRSEKDYQHFSANGH